MNEYNEAGFEMKIPLPQANLVLALGVLSVVGACCYGIIGLILGILALFISSSDLTAYTQNPSRYLTKSYNNLTTGRTCAIIGIVLSCIVLMFIILGNFFTM